MNKPIANAMLRGIRAQGWHLIGHGGSVAQAIKPLEAVMERRVAKAKKADEALLRQALDCLENHVMQRTYASGVVICNTAIALRERLGEKT
jgi:hypothetical protein